MVCTALFMQSEVPRHIKTCLVSGTVAASLAQQRAGNCKFARLSCVILWLPEGGRASKRFCLRMGWHKGALTNTIQQPFLTCFWGLQYLPQNQHFSLFWPGVTIRKAGISLQCMRTFYVRILLHLNLENAGETQWCGTFEATKLNPCFILKAQRDDWTYAMNIYKVATSQQRNPNIRDMNILTANLACFLWL